MSVEHIATLMVVVGCARLAVDTLANNFEQDLPTLARTMDHAIGTPHAAPTTWL